MDGCGLWCGVWVCVIISDLSSTSCFAILKSVWLSNVHTGVAHKNAIPQLPVEELLNHSNFEPKPRHRQWCKNYKYGDEEGHGGDGDCGDGAGDGGDGGSGDAGDVGGNDDN